MLPTQDRRYRLGHDYRDMGKATNPADQFLGWINVAGSGMRNMGGIRPLRFHLFALGVAPSHGTFNVVDVGVPVTVDGVRIAPGDLIHADANGVTTVPIEIADRVYAQCRKVHEHERALGEYVIGKDFTLDGLRERVLGRASH